MRAARSELRAVAWPVATYWGAVVLSFGLLAALAALLGEPLQAGDRVVLGALGAATALGVASGQALALLRVRTWAIASMGGIWAGVWLLAIGLVTTEWLALSMTLFLLFYPFFVLCGLWSLRANKGLLAAFGPLSYLSICIIAIAERTGSDAAWYAGRKWAIWDVFTAPLLFFAVLLLLAYLAARERQRLHRWRTADVSTAPASPTALAPSIGCGGLFALLVLGSVLTASSAAVAPYLWRTGPRDGGAAAEGAQSDVTPTEQGCERSSGTEPPPEPGRPETVERAAEQTLWSMLLLGFLLFLALVGIFVFAPPARRALLVQHLRRPLWPVPPTRTVRLAWRLVEVAFADLGIERGPGETAVTLVRRARAHLPPDVDHLSLERCAEIHDRIVYGLGIGPEDTDHARRTADMAYQTLWERLTEMQKLRAVYRWP